MIEAPALSHPISFRILVDEAMKLTRRHFRSIYLPAALPMAVVQVLTGLVQMAWMGSIFDLSDLVGLSEPKLPASFWGLGAAMFLAILTLLVFQWATYNVILAAASNAVAGRAISVKSSWRWLLQGRVSATLSLMLVAVMVGWMCCCLPGVAIVVVWAFVTPVMVEEGLDLTRAFGRSVDLASYRSDFKLSSYGWVKLLVLFLIGYAVATTVSFLVQMPFLAVQQGLMFRNVLEATEPEALAGMSMGLMWLQVPMGLINTLASIAVQIYVAFGVTLLYADLRSRREGGDLDAALDALADPGTPAVGEN